MKTEFEVKILKIDIKEIKNKLKKLGAIQIATKKQRRYVYNFQPKKENSWIRLRDTGNKVQLTIKETNNNTIDGTKELEIEVNNFEDTNRLLEKLGYHSYAYQENKRISYKLNNVKIEIDTWPQIPTYLEIEGNSIEEVENTVKLLGYDMKETTSLNTLDIYLRYGIDLNKIKILKF